MMSKPDLKGMQPAAAQSLAKAMQELRSQGIPVNLNSGFRSEKEQAALYAKYLRGENPYHVDPPGTSPHQQGTAADLGIADQHREAANAILAKHGWNWNGPSDQVHYDFTGGQGDPHPNAAFARGVMQQDPISAALAKYGGGGNTQPAFQNDPVSAALAKYGGQSQQASSGLNPSLMAVQPGVTTPHPAHADTSDRGIIGNTLDYWGSTLGNVLNPFNGNTLGQRLEYAQKPISDAMDMVTGNGVLNPFRYTFNPVRAGVLQALNQENLNADNGGGFLGAYGPSGRAAIWDSMVKAFQGKPDQSTPVGLAHAFLGNIPDASGTPGLSPMEAGLAKFASGAGEDVQSLLDVAADWETGGRFAHTFFSPVLRGSAGPFGETVRAMADQPGSKFFKGIEPAVSGGVGGLSRAGADAANAWAWKNFGNTEIGKSVLPTLQSLAKTGADYRAGLDASIEGTRIMRTGDQLIGRVNNMIGEYSKKLASSGVEITGNALKGTQWDLPELQGKMDGNLVGQLTTLYKEAGSKGSFLSEPEVLQQAARLNIDPQIIQKIGDEARKIDLLAGQGMVSAGMMDQNTFAEQAGLHTRRSYKLNALTKTDAASMAQELAANGHQDTPLFALVQNVEQNGGAEPSGGFASPPGQRDVVQQREITDPMQRLARIPDLDFTKSTQSIRSQFQEIAKRNVYKSVSDPELGVSLANKMASPTYVMPAVSDQAHFQGELMRGVKQVDSIKDQFERKGGINDTQHAHAENLYKAAQDAQKARAAVISHEAAEPVEPEMPVGTKPSASPGKNRVGQLVDQASLNQYATDLNAWRKAHQSWRDKLNELGPKADRAQAAVDRAQQVHDAHYQAAEQLDQKAGEQIRRNELLAGKRAADINDANDALRKAISKMDDVSAQGMTPELRNQWMSAWLDQWNKYNRDIFHDIPPKGLPHTPAGMDPKVIEAMGSNNPLIAAAFNPNISLPGEAITAPEALKRGMVQWGSGKGDYGPMEGRWASAALKNFLDDAMDPNRFTGNARGATAGISKFFGEMMRTAKLYMNPVSTMNVFVQSIMDNWATAKDAGKVYSPKSDSLGRAEWDAWSKGGKETPTVKAMLDFGNEMAGSQRHGIDPFLASSKDPLGELGQSKPVKGFRAAKEWMKNEFVREQILPKAGLVRVLMDQGVPAEEAAMWAEKAHGGSGADMGGIETPGLMHLAENLNRNGVAMFTSYPLHSISRMMELMANRPDVVMRWPLLRGYLLGRSSAEMQAQAKQHNLELSEAPIPTTGLLGKLFANPNGGEGVINLSNAIPYGGAFGGMAFPNIANPFIKADETQTRGEASGLNPIDAQGGRFGEFIKQLLVPGTVTAGAKVLDAYAGRTPTEGATIPQTPLQAMTAFSGLPMRHPETGMSREFGPKGGQEIPSRLQRWQELDYRYAKGYDNGVAVDNLKQRQDLRNMDPEKLDGALKAAAKEMDRIMKDRSISERSARVMIQRQSDYIHALSELSGQSSARLYDYTNQAMQQGAQ